MENKKTFISNDILYRGLPLIPLDKEAVQQRINILKKYLSQELDIYFIDQDVGQINLLNKAINHWEMIKEQHC